MGDVERNGLEVSKQRESTDKMLANTGVRETELVEELSSMQEELKYKSNLVGKLEKLVEESQKQQSTIAAAGDSCAEDASKLRVDVDRLTTSNKAAQEWMANANEHSKRSNQNLARAKKEVVVLTKQLDEMKEEITTLNTTVGSLRSSTSIAKEGTMNALKLEQQVNELIQINEMLNKEKNDSVERTSDLAEAELFELRSEVSKVQAQLAEEVTNNASLVIKAESTEAVLKTERYDLEVAKIKIEEQEEYLKKMNIEASELRESSDCYIVETKLKETQLSEQISLIEKGLQEKDVTICEMEKRLEEKKTDVERNGLEICSLDKMLANTRVRETELVEELSSMQEELKKRNILVDVLQEQQSTIAAAGDSCAEDASKLQADVDRLTSSNKAAQEWMANANEHSKRSNQNLARAKKEVVVLTKQLDEKKEEITTLNTTVGSLRSSTSIAKEGTMNALKLEQQVNELIQINE